MAVASALDPRHYAFGEQKPQTVYAPESVEELAALVRACDEDGRAVVFFGGGTLQSMGAPPRRYDVAVSLAALRGVIEYEFRDLTIAVEAGMTLGDLDATLAAKGQFVPLDAPRSGAGTVGGALASGWLGPRRATYGRARDFVIGSTVVLADGSIAKAGGMVVKNVTGYDMSKLYIGSLGTLGAIVRANLRTLPLPEARRAAVAALPERTRQRTLEHVAALELEPAAALLVRGFANEIEGRDGLDGRILLFLEGSRATIERATRELRSALGAAGVPETTILDREAAAVFARALDAYVAPLAKRSVTYRALGAPGELQARTAAVESLAREHELRLETIEDIRTGDLIARVSTGQAKTFAERVPDFDAAVHSALPGTQILAAPHELRARLPGWGAVPPSFEKMLALKAQFDPRGTLAPGRFVGGI